MDGEDVEENMLERKIPAGSCLLAFARRPCEDIPDDRLLFWLQLQPFV